MGGDARACMYLYNDLGSDTLDAVPLPMPLHSHVSFNHRSLPRTNILHAQQYFGTYSHPSEWSPYRLLVA
jgi:hypothetical protein